MHMTPAHFLRLLEETVPTGDQGIIEDIPLPQLQEQRDRDGVSEIRVFSGRHDRWYHERLVSAVVRKTQPFGSVTLSESREGYPLDAPHQIFLVTRVRVRWHLGAQGDQQARATSSSP